MKAYYKERAPVYDEVYSYPERQEDLRFLEEYIPGQFEDRDVIEVAAGTGYWTQFIAPRSRSILATDANTEVLREMERRSIGNSVQKQVVDAYSIDELPGTYNGAFAGLWLSHVPKQKIPEFLGKVHQLLCPQATVMFIDNSVAQCTRLPLSHADEDGNTYQDRTLENGKTYRVLKNFPTQSELMEVAGKLGTDHKFIELEHFWLFQYSTN